MTKRLSFARKHMWICSKGLIRRNMKHIFSKGSCWWCWKCLFLFKLMYSRVLLWDNGLRGLFVERKAIKISVKTDCVSLLLYMHKYRHAKCKFYPSNSIPGSQNRASSKSLQIVWFVTFSPPNSKQKLDCAWQKHQVLCTCTGTPCPENFEVYFSF